MTTQALRYLLVAGAGVGVGYFVARKRLEEHYFSILADETDEARQHYKDKYEALYYEKVARDKQLKEAADALAAYSGVRDEPVSEILETETGDVVESDEKPEIVESLTAPVTREAAPTKNYNAISTKTKITFPTPEKTETPIPEKRSAVAPYEISQKEFIDNDRDFKQFTFTYFKGDDVLANQSDENMPMALRLDTLGEKILESFRGEGLDAIYVRNEANKWEFEITRSPGRYEDEVGAKRG